MKPDSQTPQLIKPELIKIVPKGASDTPTPEKPGKAPEHAKTEPFGQILIIAVCVVIGAAFFVHVISSTTDSKSPYSKLDLSQKETPTPAAQVAGASSVVGPPKKPSVSPKATTNPTVTPTSNPTPTNTPTPLPTKTPTPTQAQPTPASSDPTPATDSAQ